MGEIEVLDAPWTYEKIMLLLQGEMLRVVTDDNGRDRETLVEHPTAYELRTSAYDRGDTGGILEPMRLLDSIAQIRDNEVRALLTLIVKTGEDPYNLESTLEALGVRTRRSLARLVERGADLVRRQERAQHSTLRRVRSAKGQSDSPRCWRCMQVEVDTIGQDCGSTCSTLAPPSTFGVKPRFVYADSKPAAEMTEDEREAELAHLIKTQFNEANFTGQRQYARREVTYGLAPNPGMMLRGDVI